ncbi:hypothetical protein [Chryseobacterium sp. CH21]|uniref:hypothetical protein n=1 Tax=Chryseobacterium sp. CH21 TaxID=713556 RepID=UPI001E42A135|nr:hypothetical protein [Chryseobacterium sp. CH21]
MKYLITMSILSIWLWSCNNEKENISEKLPTAEIELFAEVSSPVGNIAYKNSGELVFSNHPFLTHRSE